MKNFYYKDEVWFTEETSSYKLLHGTVIIHLTGSDKVLIACSEDLKTLRYVPSGWYVGKKIFNDLVEEYGQSYSIGELYENRIKPLSDTHLFKWFDGENVTLLSSSPYTLEELINNLQEDVQK